MKTLQRGQVQPEVGISFQSVQDPFQFLPVNRFLARELVQIDDHSNCLCFTSKYWLMSSADNRGSFSWVKETPYRFNSLPVSTRSRQMRCPPRFSYSESREWASGRSKRGCTFGGRTMFTSTRCLRQTRETLRTKPSASTGSERSVRKNRSALFRNFNRSSVNRVSKSGLTMSGINV